MCVGGPENGNLLLLYVMKMSHIHRGWVVLKSLKTTLRNIKMVPPNREKFLASLWMAILSLSYYKQVFFTLASLFLHVLTFLLPLC